MDYYNTREEFLSDVLETAINGGGVQGWADVTRIWRDDNHDLMVAARIRENETGLSHHVTRVTIEDGIIAVNTRKAGQVSGQLYDLILWASVNNDATNIDAQAASVIVQAGLFTRIEYD